MNKENTVVLSNGSIAYAVYINGEGYLETLHFGKCLNGGYDCVRKGNPWKHSYFDLEKGEEAPFKDGYKCDCAPLELSSHGYWDKSDSAIRLKKADFSFESNFRYVSHSIYRGTHKIENMPCAHGDNCQTAEFILKDSVADIYVRLYITLFDDKDIVVKSFDIINKSDSAVKILCAASMQLGLISADYTLTHFHGRHASEMKLCENSLCDGTFEVACNYGISSHYANPFMYLKKNDATQDFGEVIGFNLIYSGNFKFRVSVGTFCNAFITYGINDEDFEWTLEAGQSFSTPQAVLSYSYEGVGKMSRNFHAFIRENLITYRHDKEYKPILFNSWEGCNFNFDTKSIISYIDDACRIGTEIFVLDDGWFGKRDNDSQGLGDWTVNSQKIDLHRVIEHCTSKGIKFGIWFEPEMVSYDSNLYKAHPTWVLGGTDKSTRYLYRHQFLLDFTNPEVVDGVYAQLTRFLSEYHVDYIKWDFNRNVYEHYSPRLNDRQGEVYHRLTLGFYSLISRVRSQYPDIMIEGCASGGGRFDMGNLYFCPQIWASDEINPARRIYINYSLSLGYPLSCIGTHVNDSEVASYKEKAIFALFGTYGYEMNPNKLTEEQIGELSQIAAIYKKYHAEVIENGILYHLSSPYKSNNMALQCVSRDKSKCLILYTAEKHEMDVFRYVKLKGLSPEKSYRVSVDGNVYSGQFLMTVGLNLSFLIFKEHEFRLIVCEEEF